MAMLEMEFKGILIFFSLSPVSLRPCLGHPTDPCPPCLRLEEASGALTRDHSHERLSGATHCWRGLGCVPDFRWPKALCLGR